MRRQPPNLANHTLPPKRATIIPRKRPINYLLCIYIYIENVGPGGGVDHIYIYIHTYIDYGLYDMTMDLAEFQYFTKLNIDEIKLFGDSDDSSC